jgi:hypothetical protein
MTLSRRQSRLRVLEVLDQRARQFKAYENIWPFRVPHEPLALDEIIDDSLPDHTGTLDTATLKSRVVLRLEWTSHTSQSSFDVRHTWEAWVIALPSRVMLYCDDDGEERRILASIKRGNPTEADGFFLELLAESRGQAFGIEMTGTAPDRVRTAIADREFLTDVFVDLYEGTEAEAPLRQGSGAHPSDFRVDVARWLSRALIAPPMSRPARRQLRRRDESP